MVLSTHMRLCMTERHFLGENPLWAEMTKNSQKMTKNWVWGLFCRICVISYGLNWYEIKVVIVFAERKLQIQENSSSEIIS